MAKRNSKKKKNVVETTETTSVATVESVPTVEVVEPVLETATVEQEGPVLPAGPSPLPVDRTLESTARESVFQTFDKVVQHTELRLAGLAEGEKVTMKVLCQELSAELNLPTDRLYHLVTLYVSRRSDVHVARGQDGGLYRGELAKKIDPVKAEKLSRKAQDMAAKAREMMAAADKLLAKAGLPVAQS